MTREIISNRDIERIRGGNSAHTSAEKGMWLREEVVPYAYENTLPRERAQEPDSYTERLMKYIPAEVIALYLTLDALIRSSPQFPASLYWAVFLFCFVATYLYLWRIEKVRKQVQLHISGSAFIVWVFAIGGPFAHLSWYNPIYAGILLPIFTFLVALIEA